jgi:hypothetical protein
LKVKKLYEKILQGMAEQSWASYALNGEAEWAIEDL